MRNSTTKTRWPTALVAFLPAVCAAQATVGDLSKIQGETMILKAKISRETALADLEARARAAGHTAEDNVNLPVVKSVYGVRDTLVATFLYPNGTTQEAKVGDTLNGGFKVTKVEVSRVELEKDKKVVQLGFSAIPVAVVPPTSAGLPGMPGMSPSYLQPPGR